MKRGYPTFGSPRLRLPHPSRFSTDAYHERSQNEPDGMQRHGPPLHRKVRALPHSCLRILFQTVQL
jgi:hypothetical protein